MSSAMIFTLVIIAMFVVGRLVKQGMALQGRRHGASGALPEPFARIERENAALRNKAERLEGRMAVLERIATDSPARLTAQIDRLRD